MVACMRREANTDAQPIVRTASDTSDRIVATTVGDEHACALSARDVAYCWGTSDSWLLGTEDPVMGATRVAGDHRFKSVAAGGRFTCAVDIDGQAYCWGRGHKGELGAGAFFDASQVPQPVSGEHRFVSLVGGREHACALDRAGAAWCWGDNEVGQLGDSTTSYASRPVLVLGGQRFKLLGAGAESNTTCGVTFLDEGFCWGANESGQAGNGITRSSMVPVRVKGLSNLRSIDAGADATCALTNAGAVYCWGDNTLGQLGAGYAVRDPLITSPSRVRVPERFVSVSAGDKRACAVASAGATYCWGSAAEPMLGAGADDVCTERKIRCTRNPILVRGGRLAQVAVGPSDRACGAASSSGRVAVYCWGRPFNTARQ